MLSVALTGNVAAGKSMVAARWAEMGVPVVSADDLARRAVVPDGPGLRAVTEAFGEGVLSADGTLDRGRLREIVFAEAAARERLEQILHPIIWTLREEWLDERRTEGVALAVSEIPLLFETGRQGDFDAVVLVDAPVEVRLGRIIENRGLDEIEARLSHQDSILSAGSTQDRTDRREIEKVWMRVVDQASGHGDDDDRELLADHRRGVQLRQVRLDQAGVLRRS